MMRSDIEILMELFKEEATVNRQGNNAVLEERDGTNYRFTIASMPINSIIIKADRFTAPLAVFADTKHECKRADFVIIAERKKGKVIICIELKAKNKNIRTPDVVRQLKGAKCFVAYCQDIGREFWDEPEFLKDCKFRYIAIVDNGINKRPTYASSRGGIHDQPEKFMKISGHRVEFGSLIGKQ